MKNKCDEYLFDDNDEDYDLYSTSNKQYQSFSDKNLLPFDEYLERIRPKLTELMTKYCKVRLNANVIFRLERFKKSNDQRSIYIKSKNTTDIDEIFDQLIEKHEELSESLKNIDLISEGIESLTYNLSEFTVTNAFIETPQWITNKKCTINPQDNDSKCFQYSMTLSLYHQQIGKNSYRISKIKPFIDNLNWDNVNFPSEEQDYKIFEMNNKSIALNILRTHRDTRKISHAYKSKFNKTRKTSNVINDY